MKKRKYRCLSKEYCETVARKCKSLSELNVRDRSVLHKAMREGWLDEYTWLRRKRVKRGTYSKEACLKLAKKFTRLVDFRREFPHAEIIARRNGWLQSYKWLKMLVTRVRWTTAMLVKESRKYKTRGEFYKGSPAAYNVALRHDLLQKFTWLQSKE